MATPQPSLSKPVFSRSYIGSTVSKHYPAAYSKAHFTSGKVDSGLHYTHESPDWIMSFALKSKSLFHKSTEHMFSILELSQSIQQRVNIYFPLVWTYGLQVSYLTSAHRHHLSPNHKLFNSEIGTGVVTGLRYYFLDSGAVFFELERWRGTGSNKLHAFGVTLGLDLEFSS